MIELLSPAGDFDSLVAAVQNGADAVYLGGKSLNARRGAGNFDRDGLKRAADYLHERGKLMYVTVNTMVKQNEMGLLEETAEDIAYAGADAAIVQDFGVCELLRLMIPDLRLHASTQMAVHNASGAMYLKNRGFERVVLARELTYEEISACSACGIETEVFCHGALCVACSGQCLFSSLVGGRSGNRGMCAQPCRLPYKLNGAVKAEGYLLSPKDIMTADEISRMNAAGVSSLKIEGRLKRPEYVATVTRVYRKAIDGEKITESDIDALKQIFNRGGFTRGYASGIRDRELLSTVRPSHWGVKVGVADTSKSIRITKDIVMDDALVIRGKEEIPVKLEGFAGRTIKNPTGKTGDVMRLVSAAQMLEAKESFTGEHILIPVKASLTLKTGFPAFCSLTDGKHTVSAEGQILEKSQKAPFDAERVKTQFGKTGGTPYTVTDTELDADDDAFVPVSVINALRRACLEKLSAERIESARGCGKTVRKATVPASVSAESEPPLITVQGNDLSLLRKLLSAGADDAVYFPADLRSIPDIHGMYLYLPPVMNDETLKKLNSFALNSDIKGVYISNIGQLNCKWPGEIRYDFSLNTANTAALSFLGAQDSVVTPSVELTVPEITAVSGRKELVVYGRLPLMHLRHCPLNAARGGGKHADCRACDRMECSKRLDSCSFTDRMNVSFPLRRLASDEGCVIDILNSVPLDLSGHIQKLPKALSWRMIFTDENENTALAALKRFKEFSGERPAKFTTGHYFRGVD